jgi:hypothetical protein
MAKKTLTTIERQNAAKTFSKSVLKKIGSGCEFTPEERQAAKIVADMISNISSGWKNAGAKRMKKPTKSALYLRMNRARKALEAAIDPKQVQPSRSTLAHLRAEFEQAEKDYNNFVKREKRQK